MAEYLSKYTGQEIDQRLDKITDLENNVNSLMSTSTTNNVYKFGDLVIQIVNMSQITANTITEVTFPQAFKNECIFVGIQGGQIHPQQNSGFSTPLTLQAQIIDTAKCRIYINNALGAALDAKIIAIGH